MKQITRLWLVLVVLTATSCSTVTTVPVDSQWMDKPAHEQAAAIADGELSSQTLVAAYLQRIERLDPKINSILLLNPQALAQAKAVDEAIAAGRNPGPLAGIPVLLKDNIETKDMPTTAGSLALAANATRRDSPLVTELRRAGAIILGKTNLSEWANFRSEDSISGWSGMGGLTHNPHMLSRSACGSSSGSGAAVAAQFASLAVGTETNGSIICPASLNGVVGFKPTVGLISRTHIVPISFTQDTAGPMTLSVMDAALMAQVMASTDSEDGATQSDMRSRVANLSNISGNLKGKRIGVMRYRQGDDPWVLAAFNRSLETLKQQGAVLIEVNDFEQPESFWADSYTVLLSEFKASINDYLASTPASIPVRDLQGLIDFNTTSEREMALFDQSIFLQSLASPGLQEKGYKDALALVRDTATTNGLDALLSKYKLDVIVAPSNSPAFLIDAIYGDHSPPGFIGIGYLAAIAGYPHLTVPMGEVKGLPVGLSFIGGAWQDKKVLDIGYGFEQAHHFLLRPRFIESRKTDPALQSFFEPVK